MVMGCTSSRNEVCPNCQTTYMPVRRSSSLRVREKSRRSKKTGGYSNSHSLVSLTSSTLGSLNLDPLNRNGDGDEGLSKFEIGLIESKTWSKMIEEKIPKFIPKTPGFTPPGEPEKINAWELMEGLEEVSSPLRPSHHFHTLSLNIPIFSDDTLKQELLSPQSENESEFDPDVIAAFRQAFQDLPSASPIRLATKKEKVIVYFTSLRGVRKTYEECCQVLSILKSIGARIDERDVSMHSGFKEELKDLLLDCGVAGSSLPRVFIGKRYIGGWEEIRGMNEEGELGEFFQGCERYEDEDKFCEVCGNIRFIPCQKCSGSCKILYEDDEERADYDGDDDRGFRRCPDCNENGLLRCPNCCD